MHSKPEPLSPPLRAASSRRHALALMLGAARWLSAAPAPEDPERPIRLALSESLVTNANMNDARAAMIVWIRRMTVEMNVSVQYNPNVFDTTQEILSRVRKGQADAVAINVIEYRQIADLLDPTQIVAQDDGAQQQYVLLVKRDSGIQKLGDLRGRRLIMQKVPNTCVAPAWLSTLLSADHLDQSERFFSAVTTDSKPSRVLLPVFFGQAEASLITKRGLSTMYELNPQLPRKLKVLATSPEMVATFYIFRKNYHGANRQRLVRALSTLVTSPTGRQLMTFFQVENLLVRDATCLAGALKVLELSQPARGKLGARGQKG